jgi:hypothetical protein
VNSVYVKSVLAGIAALIVAAVLVLVMFSLRFSALRRSGALDGIGAVSFGINPRVLWICVALIFAAGFLWEFQRAAN